MTTVPTSDGEAGPAPDLAELVKPVVIAPVKADDALAHRVRRRASPDPADHVATCDHHHGNEGRVFCSGCGAKLGRPPEPIDERAGGDGHRPGPVARVLTPAALNLERIRGARQVRFLPFERPPERAADPDAPPAPTPAKGPDGAPVPRARPTPPEPVDALRAGLARPPKPRIALRWAMVAVATLLAVLIVLFRSPLVNNVRSFLADVGIGRSAVYDRVLVQSVWADEIVPGRSGRYVADGLATTYWAFTWKGPPPVGSLREASVVLDLEHEHEIDQVGISLGIQNGDAPFTANPRPRVLLITVGDCPPVPESCAAQQQRVVVEDKPAFERYAIDIAPAGRRVTVQVVDVYPSLKSASVRPAPLGSTTTTLAGQLVPATPSLTSWAALTEVVLFQRS